MALGIAQSEKKASNGAQRPFTSDIEEAVGERGLPEQSTPKNYRGTERSFFPVFSSIGIVHSIVCLSHLPPRLEKIY